MKFGHFNNDSSGLSVAFVSADSVPFPFTNDFLQIFNLMFYNGLKAEVYISLRSRVMKRQYLLNLKYYYIRFHLVRYHELSNTAFCLFKLEFGDIICQAYSYRI